MAEKWRIIDAAQRTLESGAREAAAAALRTEQLRLAKVRAGETESGVARAAGERGGGATKELL